MIRVLITLAILGLTIYAVIDCVRSEGSGRMRGPTWAWVALIIVLPVVGALVWLTVARASEATSLQAQRPMPQAPDDDPDFLRYLQQRNRRGDAGPGRGMESPTDPSDRDDDGDRHGGATGEGSPSDDHPGDTHP